MVKKLQSVSFFIYFFLLLFFSIFLFIRTAHLDSWRPLFNDDYSLGYPLRILVSTSLRNYILPLWDHWTHGGFPLSVISLSLSISPFIWFISIFGIYTMKLYVVEMLLMHGLGFIGCYLWLRRYAKPWVSGIGAFCYTLMASGLVQAPINFEATASGYTYPWIALGISLALQRKMRGIGILALSLWWMFTTGYAGMNLIACEFIFTFSIIEYIIYLSKPIQWKKILHGIFFVGIGIVLFFCIYSLPLFETWYIYGFDMKQIREPGSNNPFAASARASAFWTMFFPNGVSPFIPDAFDGYEMPLYFGALNVLFAIFALLYPGGRRKTAWILTGFFIFSFLSTLSSRYALSKYFVAYFPFFRDSRWHAWNMNIPTFFAVTLSAIGLQNFFRPDAVKQQFIACYIYAVLLMSAGILWQNTFATSPIEFLKTPQCIVFIVFIVTIMLFFWLVKHSERWSNRLLLGTVFFILIELWAVSRTLVSLSGM
ncbi:TPA: hypothetical protein DIS60_04480, partial [Patescibacteria group bacterium]|nr:hypothetical protein [Patescibacteria group bacterium]